MRWRDRMRVRPDQEITAPQEIKKTQLDDISLFFLTEYFDALGKPCMYSVGAERAEDSHYEFAPAQARKLERCLEAVYHKGSLAEDLRAFFGDNRHDIYLRSFMNKHGIEYKEYHFY